MILVRHGVIAHLASGNLSSIIARTDRWGLHQSGSGTIYSKSAFWDVIPFILSEHFWRGEQALDDMQTDLLRDRDRHMAAAEPPIMANLDIADGACEHTSAELAPTDKESESVSTLGCLHVSKDRFTVGKDDNSDMRRLQALCCQNWRSAIRNGRLRNGRLREARQILASKRDAPKRDAPAPKQNNRKVNTFKEVVALHLQTVCLDASKWPTTATVLEVVHNCDCP
jgi:hypothetical protein